MHNWTDAEVAVICEINAAYWKKQGREEIAGAFKRAAHLAFQSVARWQRPSGELWIIKNRAEPQERFAFETYSNHSQYNLLPMAMLAIAYSRADDSIQERPSPAEVGGYVFDARQQFHKITAAAGGYYVEIDTAADPHYNATGLQRVQRAGVWFSALSDTVAQGRAYGPANIAKAAVAMGVRWRSKAAGAGWTDLSSFSGGEGVRKVRSADLQIVAANPALTRFKVTYTLAGDGPDDRIVTEDYRLSDRGVELNSTVSGSTDGMGLHFPVLVSDGAKPTQVKLRPNSLSTTENGSTTTITIPSDTLAQGITVLDRRLMDHSGDIKEATAAIRSPTAQVVIKLDQTE